MPDPAGAPALDARPNDRSCALRQVTRVLASSREATDVFTAVARAASTVLGATAVAVWLAEPSEGSLKVRWTWGPGIAHGTNPIELPAIRCGEDIAGRAFRAGEAEYVSDVQDDAGSRSDALAAATSIHAAAFVPLVAGDRPVGVLSILFADGRAFDAEQREFLAVLADHAAIAARDARALEDGRPASPEAAAEGRARDRELRRAIDELATELAREDDLDRMLASFTERTCALLAADGASFARLEGDEIVFEHQFGFPPLRPTRRKLDEIRAGSAIAAGQVVVCPDLAADGHWRRSPLVAHGFRAILAVPVFHGALVAGMLAVHQRAPRAFSDDETHLLGVLARHLAVALDRAGRQREQDLLLAVTQAIGSTLDLTEVMRRVARGLALALGADMVGAYLADTAARALHAVAGYHVPKVLREAFRAHPIPLDGAIAEAWRRRTVSWTSDAGTHPAMDREMYARFPHQSVLFAPIVAGGGPAGAFIAVWWRQRHVFTSAEARLAEAISHQAGIAVGNARLYEETERQRREAEALARVVRDINASLDRDVLLERVCQSARHLCQSDLAALALREEDSDAFVERHEVGARGALRKLRILPGRGAGGWVLLSRRPFRTENYAADARITAEYTGAVDREGLVSVLAVPVQREGEVEALLYVANRSPRPFTDRDEAALLRLADHVAVALANSRMFTREAEARQEAQTSEQRVRDLMDSLDAVVWEWDADAGRYSFVSQRAETMLGVPLARREVERDVWMSRVHPDDRARVAAAREAAIARSEDCSSEYRIVSASGEVRWVRERVTVARGPGGRARHLRAVVLDVTVRRQAEDQLRKLSRAVDQSPVAIVVTDVTGAIEYVNPRFTALTGYRQDEVLGKNPRYLKSGSTEVDEYRRFWAVITSGREWSGVLENRRKDGTTYWASASVSPIRDAAGAVTHFVGIQEDITARKAAEEALRESEARFRTVTEAAPDAIVSADSRGVVVSWNEAARAMFGYVAEEIVGRPLLCLMPPDYRARHQKALAAASDGGRLASAGTIRELEGVRKDGTRFPIELTVSRWVAGGCAYYTGILRDVTERVRAQAALQQAEQQLWQAQKMEALGRVAGGVAHDFNNLMTVVLSRSELLLARVKGDARAQRDAELIRQTGRRAADLTRQLLAFSRKQVLQPKVLELGAVVTGMLDMLRRLVREDVELATELAPEAGAVLADRTQLEQVLLNLVVNARDAMPRGGTLTIRTAGVDVDATMARLHPGVQPGRHVLLEVRDTGHGMGAETLSRLFEPFFTTKGPDHGTGLGLATVYGIVKQHGGVIWAESQPGAGSTFRILLPVVDQRAEEADAAALAPVTARGAETILVVEDEADVREIVREILESGGYTVLEATNGGDALATCARHPGRIHLLIADVILPGLDGPHLVQLLGERRPDTKILYISGHAEETLSTRGVLAGTIELLSKPFTPDALLERVRQALGSAEATVSPA